MSVVFKIVSMGVGHYIGSAEDSSEHGALMQVRNRWVRTDHAWFDARHAENQVKATKLNSATTSCNSLLTKATGINVEVELARKTHASCRELQGQMAKGNVTDSCLADKKKDCDSIQVLFETGWCAWSSSQLTNCKDFETCHATAKESRVADLAYVQHLESMLKAEFVHDKRKECRIKDWPSTAVKLVECNTAAHDVTKFDLVYPDLPSVPGSCMPVPNQPGQVSWKAQEYDTKNWGELVAPVVSCAMAAGPVCGVRYLRWKIPKGGNADHMCINGVSFYDASGNRITPLTVSHSETMKTDPEQPPDYGQAALEEIVRKGDGHWCAWHTDFNADGVGGAGSNKFSNGQDPEADAGGSGLTISIDFGSEKQVSKWNYKNPYHHDSSGSTPAITAYNLAGSTDNSTWWLLDDNQDVRGSERFGAEFDCVGVKQLT